MSRVDYEKERDNSNPLWITKNEFKELKSIQKELAKYTRKIGKLIDKTIKLREENDYYGSDDKSEETRTCEYTLQVVYSNLDEANNVLKEYL